MGSKDTKAKEFLADNRRFADLFNYYLYDGRQVIKPEELQERDPTEVVSIYGIDRKEIQKQRWRDLLRSAIIKEGANEVFVLLGVENQSEIHYAMPVRNMVYDAMSYAAQTEAAARKHRVEKGFSSGAEFLSGFTREDRLVPVVTLTVYWGAEAWDAPRSLHEMFPEEAKGLLKYVDDYHLHLLVPGEITDFRKFKTSVGEVLEIIKYSRDEKSMNAAIHGNPAFNNLEREAVSAINLFTGFEIPVKEKEDKLNMGNAWEDHWLDGKEKGIKEGKEEGIKEGIKEGIAAGKAKGIEALILDNLEEGKGEEAIIAKLVRRFDLTDAAARSYFDKYAKTSA